MAFYWVAPAAFLAAIVFMVLFVIDLKKAGYRAVKLESGEGSDEGDDEFSSDSDDTVDNQDTTDQL